MNRLLTSEFFTWLYAIVVIAIYLGLSAYIRYHEVAAEVQYFCQTNPQAPECLRPCDLN